MQIQELLTATQIFTEAKSPRGDCFEVAAKNTIDNPNLVLVHAFVSGQGPLEGRRFEHAWNEDGDIVIDNSNGRKIKIPKILYYTIGRIDTDNPEEYRVYNKKSAIEHMLRTEHWGPWELRGSSDRPASSKKRKKDKVTESEVPKHHPAWSWMNHINPQIKQSLSHVTEEDYTRFLSLKDGFKHKIDWPDSSFEENRKATLFLINYFKMSIDWDDSGYLENYETSATWAWKEYIWILHRSPELSMFSVGGMTPSKNPGYGSHMTHKIWVCTNNDRLARIVLAMSRDINHSEKFFKLIQKFWPKK